MQLDTLLSSLFKNWISPLFKIDVIYNDSAFCYEEAYKKLQNKYPQIILHKECAIGDTLSFSDYLNPFNIIRIYRNPLLRKSKTNFRSLLIGVVKESKTDNIMFLTDDSMFINQVELEQDIFDWINSSPVQRQFSLRMGVGKKKIPENVMIDDRFCIWSFLNNIDSWGYRFSVDGHIYNRHYILNLLCRNVFVNPNTLESHLNSYVKRMMKLCEGRCFREIKMLTFPINMVQNSVDNIAQNVSVEMLSNR